MMRADDEVGAVRRRNRDRARLQGPTGRQRQHGVLDRTPGGGIRPCHGLMRVSNSTLEPANNPLKLDAKGHSS